MSVSDSFFTNFNVGQAAGLRGAQFREQQRQRLAKENVIALQKAAQAGEQLGMFTIDKDTQTLDIGDNFLMDGALANEVRKTFFNNTAIGKTIKFKNKDGSIDPAKLNNFIEMQNGEVALELERPDGKLVPATEEASDKPDDPVVTLPSMAIKELLQPAMVEFNIEREPGYYNRIESGLQMSELAEDKRKLEKLKADKRMIDSIYAGNASNADPVELRNIVVNRLNTEIDTALEEDDFATDPRDGASYGVEPGDNLKNRIVSAATGKGVVLPDEPEPSEEDRMNTPYTTAVWNSATGSAKQIALATAQGAGAVAETFANIWNTTPDDVKKLKANVKEFAKGTPKASVTAISAAANNLNNKFKGSDRNIQALQNVTDEITRLESATDSIKGTNRWKALYAQANSKKDKLLAQGYKLGQDIDTQKTTISRTTSKVVQEPGPNSTLKRGEVEPRQLIMEDYEAQLQRHLKNPTQADLDEYAKNKIADVLKEKGVNSYEELITNEELAYDQKKLAIKFMAFEAYKQFQEARSVDEARSLYGANGPAYYQTMYQDLINGAPDLTTDQVIDNARLQDEYYLKLDKYNNELGKDQLTLIEGLNEDYKEFTEKLYPEGLSKPSLDTGEFKAAYQKILNNVKKFQIIRKQNPKAPISDAERAAYDAYQQATDEVLIQIAAKDHEDKWPIIQKDFHWFGLVDGSHGASDLAIGGKRLDIGPDVVKGSMRGITLSNGGELELNRNRIEDILGDGAIAQLQEYARYFDDVGYYASHINRK